LRSIRTHQRRVGSAARCTELQKSLIEPSRRSATHSFAVSMWLCVRAARNRRGAVSGNVEVSDDEAADAPGRERADENRCYESVEFTAARY
jgi:hypothetical protein